jgi:xanthine dehydrogenase accessory factor
MKELKDIINAYDKAVSQNKQTALATVVQVEGSSYRRPGARMLITAEGEITGAISGGCLEGDALRKAQHAMQLGQNKLLIYDTIHEEDQNFGIQLGCNGIVYILLEPILQEDANHPIHLLKKVAQDRKAAVLVTVFNPDKNAAQPGTCLVVQEAESKIIPDERMDKELAFVLQQKKTIVIPHSDQSVLYQFVPPSVHLVIVGAGNDAQPLVEMAFLLGWNMTVVDGRPAYASLQRFPKANQVCIAKPDDPFSAIQLDAQTAVVLMTHNYNYDLAALEPLIGSACAYIGLLGPKQKLEKMLNELHAKGLKSDPDLLCKLHGPVGLDIGAETAEEIALSIMAEIKAVFSDRRGTPLKNRPVEIHERPHSVQHG